MYQQLKLFVSFSFNLKTFHVSVHVLHTHTHMHVQAHQLVIILWVEPWLSHLSFDFEDG